MSTCSSCGQRNPAVPVYSKAKPPVICNNCRNGLGNVFPPATGGTNRETTVIAGDDIAVDDLSNVNEKVYRVNYSPLEQLVVTLVLNAFAGVDQKTNPVLFGTTIDKVDLSWSYNREIDVQLQSLTNDGGLTPPTLGASERDFIYDPVTITDDIAFTISGDDGKGQPPQSQDSDQKSVTFGNYALQGARANLIGETGATAKSFLDTLAATPSARVLTTTRVRDIILLGNTLERDYYAYPKKFGYATFFQNGFPGGFLRLSIKSGDVVASDNFDADDPGESPFLVNNGLAEEEYLVYMTPSDLNIGALIEVA